MHESSPFLHESSCVNHLICLRESYIAQIICRRSDNVLLPNSVTNLNAIIFSFVYRTTLQIHLICCLSETATGTLNIYSVLICSSTRNYSRVFFASRHLLNRTFHFTSNRQRTFHSNCSSLLNTKRKWPVGKVGSCHQFSTRSTCFRELGNSIQAEQTDSNMEPYFEASYAKLGTSSCKKCKEKIEKGSLRLAKVMSS